jgi:perosamine synthetase
MSMFPGSFDIPHNRPTLGPEESRAAERVLETGWVAQGPEVEAFENDLCSFLGLPDGHAVAVSSGTAALFLALWALGARNKRVILPGYSCSALRHATAMAGAQEMIADTSKGSPNMDVETIVSSPADIAVVAHMYGLPADVSKIKIPVIEDCAQALGASASGLPVGLRGEIGIHSFYATKLLTSGGQGGMVVSKDRTLADAVRDYRQFDCRRDSKVRFNFQMTDLQAAIGRVQLRRLPEFLDKRVRIFERYGRSGMQLVDASSLDPHHPSPVRYRAVLKTTSPERTLASLERAGIGAIVPINDWELLGRSESLPNALELTRTTVSLPIYPSLSDDAVDRVIETVRNSLPSN